jgi:hypothetical protein
LTAQQVGTLVPADFTNLGDDVKELGVAQIKAMGTNDFAALSQGQLLC